MPTYDFKCDRCGEIYEYIVPLTTSLPEKCKCGEEQCKFTKIDSFSSSKPILKGKGFYETDYKHKK
jgi:putative FmdB family regulatory protein